MATSRQFFLLLILTACSPLPGQESKPSSSPNVLMIAIDDLRPMLGCYGDRTVQSPNIDALAGRGLVFERAYCQLAKCGPSRLSLMTGLRPDAVRVFGHKEEEVAAFREKNPELPTMGRWFKDHGYHTQCFGKIYHDGWDDPRDWSAPSMPGREKEMLEIVDEEAIAQVPFEKRSEVPTMIAERTECPAIQAPDVPDETLFAGRMTNAVIETLRERKQGDQPFFLAVGYRRPHLPFVAPKKWFDRYQPDQSWLPADEVRQPPKDAPIMGWFNSDGYVGTARKQGLKMPNPPRTEAEGVAFAGYELRSYLGIPNKGVIPDPKQLEIQHAYRACISYVDDQIGRLLRELKTLGLENDTIIALWSDHGWHLGEQAAWSKMTNFEVAARVVFVLAAPGESYQAGKTESLAELVDLYPTLCDLTGLPKPEHLAGDSLVPILKDPGEEVKEVALTQYPRFREKFLGRAARTNRYRYVEWEEIASGEVVARELYDHDKDPHETVNIANRPESLDIFKNIEIKK